MRSLSLLPAFGLVMGAVLVAPPTAVAAAAAPIVVSAAADTYVVKEAPTTAYGTAAKLTATNWTTWHSEAYVRFAVPTAPEGRRLEKVTLNFSFERMDNQATKIELRKVAENWTESTTYANRPTAGEVIATATTPGQGATTLSFDVTGTVKSAGTYSFAITNPSAASAAVFHAREQGGAGPRLSIDYASASPPLCGASFTSESTGETYQEALARVDGYYNGLEMARVFYSGLPQNWPGKLNTNGRPISVSFKATPQDVIDGKHDVAMRKWFAEAPKDRTTWWTFYHEPEDNIRDGHFTSAQFKQAFRHLSELADAAGNPRLRATLILMGWTLDAGSNRDWLDYYPGREYVDVLGWDTYNDRRDKNEYEPAAHMFSKIVEISEQENLPFSIAETGSALIQGDDGRQRAAWLRDMITYLTEHDAEYVAYFDIDWTQSNDDFRIRDTAGQAVWREFCS